MFFLWLIKKFIEKTYDWDQILYNECNCTTAWSDWVQGAATHSHVAWKCARCSAVGAELRGTLLNHTWLKEQDLHSYIYVFLKNWDASPAACISVHTTLLWLTARFRNIDVHKLMFFVESFLLVVATSPCRVYVFSNWNYYDNIYIVGGWRGRYL